MVLIKYKWTLMAAIIGAAAGYAYYYFIGCASGTCPITSSPWISTLYGTGMGLIAGMPSQKKKKDTENTEA